MRMAGQSGNQRVTVLNLEVVRSDPERGLLLVKGAVPGPNGGLLMVRSGRQVPGAEGGVIAMPTIDVLNATGKKAGSRELATEVFEAPVNVPLMHQVVVAGDGEAPRRHAQGQDARRRARRREEAVATEGDRSSATGLDPRTAVGRQAASPTDRWFATTTSASTRRCAAGRSGRRSPTRRWAASSR